MKRLGRIAIPVLLLSLLLTGTIYATPSTTLWTPATSDIQPFNVWHIGVDNYFRLSQTSTDTNNLPRTNTNTPARLDGFPTDVGLTVGVLPFEKFQMEVGIDGLFPATRVSPVLRSIGQSILFNTKVGTPEGAFFGEWFPAINVGIFDVGTKGQITNMNIADLIVGKTLGPFGRIHGGGYYGNPDSALMHQSGCKNGTSNVQVACSNLVANGAYGAGDAKRGKLQNAGGMVGYDYGFWKVKDAAGAEYNKWTVLADYASGKNFIGGYSVGMGYNFTKDIDILTGPVWFNDHVINGGWKWTVQLDINF
jgi:hypothetical protein